MFTNHLKVAFRSLLRNKSYAVINVIGLAVGIAAGVLIFLFIQFELSFDTVHNKKNRIYRLVTIMNSSQGTGYTAGVPLPVPIGLRIDYPQLENVAAIFQRSGQITVLDDRAEQAGKKFNEENGIFFTEPQFFDMFDFPWLAGDPRTALRDVNTAVLTRETAQKYFGDWRSAIGKSIKFRNQDTYRITGILRDIPANSDFPFKVVVSYNSLRGVDMNDWVGTYGHGYCFVLLPPRMSASEFAASLPLFVKKHKPPQSGDQGLSIQPLSEMHFDSRFGNYNERTISKELILGLALIGLFLLVIACVNFINLATAQAITRSKEVGVRKVLGSNPIPLRVQFLTETAAITTLAIFLALGLVETVLPQLNQLLHTALGLHFRQNLAMISFLMFVFILVTFLSGFYPAQVLASYRPIDVLKSGRTAQTHSGKSLRRGLVVFQFVIAQTLIICTLVVVWQVDFFKNASLGFDKNAVVLVPIPNDTASQSKISALRNQLVPQSGIVDVSFSTFSPSDNDSWTCALRFDHSEQKADFNPSLKWADAEYFKLYNFPFVAGRPYSQSDTVRECVVNEAFVQRVGLKDPEDAIGKTINLWNGEIVAPIVGVVRDFHDRPLQKPIQPAILAPRNSFYELINIKLQTSQAKATLASIKKIWDATYPEFVYDYQFLDDKIAHFYEQDAKLAVVYKVFAGVAIFISCLGLYGLVSFTTQQRTKEVGIRKVLGASIGSIISLFSREFILLISFAFLIAAPAAYVLMKRWLENFAYHTTIGPGLFLLTIGISVFVAILAAGYRSLRAAMANPINALRYE